MPRTALLARRSLIGAVALSTVAFAPFALATKKSGPTDDVLKLRGGATEVSLDAGAAAALQTLGVAVAPTGKAYATKSGAIRFPITRGQVDAETLAGQIRHAGGLKLSAGKTALVLDRYHINIDTNPDLSARVNRTGPDRIELFDVDTSGLSVGTEKGRTVLSGVKLTLSDTAAAALNATFGVDAFGEGLAIADATVRTKASARSVRVPMKLSLRRGFTTVALDPGTAGVLADNGVKVQPIGSARPGVSGVSFPITRGTLANGTLAGEIKHRGGLRFAAGHTNVAVTSFGIDTRTGTVSGDLYVNAAFVARAPLFNLGVDGLETVQTRGFLRATGFGLTLTGDAADALNGAFGVDLFAEGLAVGTAKTRSRLAGSRHHRARH